MEQSDLLSRRALLRRTGILGAAVAGSGAVGGLLSACGTSSGQASATSARIPAAVPGLFCDDQCASVLALKADPASIRGKVGFSVDSESFTYGVAMQKQAIEQAQTYFPNMHLTVTNGQGSVEKQSSDVDDLVARGIQVLMISPYVADALVPAIVRAQRAGVKVITVDRNANTKVTSYIASDDFANGQMVGHYLAQRLNGKGRIIVITGTPGSSPELARDGGFNHAISGYPGIKTVGTINGNFLQSTAESVMADALQRFPKGSFDAIYAVSDDMAAGAVQAMSQAGRLNENTFMVSINAEQIGLDLIASGRELAATAAYAVVSREGIMAAAKVIAGEPIPARIAVNGPLITKANVSQFTGKVGW
jgi:ribose transport system substrate-binding protein